jgi:hypothetical protein
MVAQQQDYFLVLDPAAFFAVPAFFRTPPPALPPPLEPALGFFRAPAFATAFFLPPFPPGDPFAASANGARESSRFLMEQELPYAHKKVHNL